MFQHAVDSAAVCEKRCAEFFGRQADPQALCGVSHHRVSSDPVKPKAMQVEHVGGRYDHWAASILRYHVFDGSGLVIPSRLYAVWCDWPQGGYPAGHVPLDFRIGIAPEQHPPHHGFPERERRHLGIRPPVQYTCHRMHGLQFGVAIDIAAIGSPGQASNRL